MSTKKSSTPSGTTAKTGGTQPNNTEAPADMSEQESTCAQKPPKKKYKYTRQLVRIALDDGMTQIDIATACRTQQSIVSKWKSGESRGTEQQLAPLIKKYGSRLNRTTARVYLTMDHADARWENTQFGRRILDAKALAQRCEEPKDQESWRQLYGEIERLVKAAVRYPIYNSDIQAKIKDVMDAFQVIFASIYPTKIVQVEGPILFRYTFCRFEGRVDRRGVELGRIPVSRWLVHEQQQDRFVLVRQYRLALLNQAETRWEAESKLLRESLSVFWEKAGKPGTLPPTMPSFWVDSAEDAAKWVSRIELMPNVEELLLFADGYLNDPQQIHSPHDERALPFLLRKALVEHGYSVSGVEKISGFE